MPDTARYCKCDEECPIHGSVAAPPAGSGEPVAWEVVNGKGEQVAVDEVVNKRRANELSSDLNREWRSGDPSHIGPYRVAPLYRAHPGAASGSGEPVAKNVVMIPFDRALIGEMDQWSRPVQLRVEQDEKGHRMLVRHYAHPGAAVREVTEEVRAWLDTHRLTMPKWAGDKLDALLTAALTPEGR